MIKFILVFLGPPGSGKGTQVDLLCQKLNLTKISTGELLRQEIVSASKLGNQAKRFMNQGRLVSDYLINKLLDKFLRANKHSKGFAFDGYPRNRAQNKNLLKAFDKPEKINDKIFVLKIAVSDKEVKKRLSGRRSCICGAVYHIKYNPSKKKGICDLCGGKLFVRDDDKTSVIEKRLIIYHWQIEPIFDYWREQGKLIEINGEQEIVKIHQEIVKKLGAKVI